MSEKLGCFTAVRAQPRDQRSWRRPPPSLSERTAGAARDHGGRGVRSDGARVQQPGDLGGRRCHGVRRGGSLHPPVPRHPPDPERRGLLDLRVPGAPSGEHPPDTLQVFKTCHIIIYYPATNLTFETPDHYIDYLYQNNRKSSMEVWP